MQVIISHVNTDFDALASMIAAKKLYPDAKAVISSEQAVPVKQFLSIYRDTFLFVQDNLIDWDEVTELILVDVTSVDRCGEYVKYVDTDDLKITVYDHHPEDHQDVTADDLYIEPVGATVTLLIEKIKAQGINITSLEATLFALGIYGDTGSFKYSGTTIRDFEAIHFLMQNNMNLDIIQRFTDYKMTPLQQDLLNHLLNREETFMIDGLKIVIVSYKMKEFQNGLATITNKLLNITGADAIISAVEMKKHVYIVGRAQAERTTLLPLLKIFGGGGHSQAGSAIVKDSEFETVLTKLKENLSELLKPAVTAEDVMAHPVKTLSPGTSIEEAGQLMYRYGHSGFPVVEDDRMLGIVTRRDLDKANHHDLGHAPVKAYMTRNVITITPETTLEEMQNIIIKHNIGRLPVLKNDILTGIVTRTNIIEMLHNKNMTDDLRNPASENLRAAMKKELPEEILSILKDISQAAADTGIPAFLVGGIVRDLFLNHPNDDIDIVVEGNGILFLEHLYQQFGGDIKTHEQFATGTWRHPSGQMIDVTSARLEYYSHPASLPDVEKSTLKEDLYRRDFTINSMALSLNNQHFGRLVDPFDGQNDLRRKQIKVLHNLSFIDDPTRILRAVRFEMRFNFQMDRQTETLVLHSIGRIKDLSRDRLNGQMKRLLNEGSPPKIILRLFKLNFWKQLGINEHSQKKSIIHSEKLENIYRQYEGLQSGWFIYFIIPFYHSDVLYIAKQYAATKKSKKLIQDIYTLTDSTEWKSISNVGMMHSYLKDISEEAVLFIISSENIHNEKVIMTYLKRRKNMPSLLTGEDLIKQGLTPSPEFKKIIMNLDAAVLNEEIQTKDDALKWLKNNHGADGL